MFTTKRPQPRNIRRAFQDEVDREGNLSRNPCNVPAIALRAVRIADNFQVEKGDKIDLTEREFANHPGMFERVAIAQGEEPATPQNP